MENIIQANSVQQYKDDMARYALETNRRRAFPDWKDGFKLCHRRILYAMACDLPCKTKLTKTAKVVGQVMGTYHPHGDTSISDAIKPLCNWFETYVPLLYSESNMGSMQGDRSAAPRYTEVMLNKFSLEVIFKDLMESPDVVDWVPNYSGDAMEPEYLPVALPLLLINGTYGIGTAKSVSIPSHNITEVIDATLNLIENPDAPVVLIPDQCMPCDIIEANWKQISNTGIGKVKVRARIDIETFNKGTAKEHQVLVVKSSPDMVWVDKGNAENGGVVYTIYKLIDDGKLPQIQSIFEDSHDNNMRLLIHLKPGADANYVKEFLYKSTQLQYTWSINFEVLDGIELVRFSYKSYLQAFIQQRKITKFRLACIKLQDVKTKYHEKEAYIKALESGQIDTIIKKIRTNKNINEQENIEWLVKLLKITDLQAKFILNSSIKNLSVAYLKKYKEEAAKYKEAEAIYMNKILNEQVIMDEIKSELLYFREKYGVPRRCRVLKKSDITNIPRGTFNVVITQNNFIKKMAPSDNIGAFRGDNPVQIMQVENTEDIILITAQGRMFRVPVSKIPITEKNNMGTDIRIMVKGITSNVVKMLYSPAIEDLSKKKTKFFAVVVTKNNFIKKLDLADIMIAAPSGIILTKLNQGDEVKDVAIVQANDELIIYSKRKALRCSVNDIPHYKRNTLGVFAMNTDTELDGISVIPQNSKMEYAVVITESGRVNKFSIAGLPKSQRYKAGSSVIKLGKTDSIHAMFICNDTDTIKVITKQTKMEIPVKDIKVQSSVSGGVKMIPLKADNIVRLSLN